MSKKKGNNKDKDKEKEQKSIRVSEELKDFDISINTFGEIISNYDVDKINEFLNKNIDDKKLRNRKDLNLKNEENEEDASEDESKDTEV